MFNFEDINLDSISETFSSDTDNGQENTNLSLMSILENCRQQLGGSDAPKPGCTTFRCAQTFLKDAPNMGTKCRNVEKTKQMDCKHDFWEMIQKANTEDNITKKLDLINGWAKQYGIRISANNVIRAISIYLNLITQFISQIRNIAFEIFSKIPGGENLETFQLISNLKKSMGFGINLHDIFTKYNEIKEMSSPLQEDFNEYITKKSEIKQQVDDQFELLIKQKFKEKTNGLFGMKLQPNLYTLFELGDGGRGSTFSGFAFDVIPRKLKDIIENLRNIVTDYSTVDPENTELINLLKLVIFMRRLIDDNTETVDKDVMDQLEGLSGSHLDYNKELLELSLIPKEVSKSNQDSRQTNEEDYVKLQIDPYGNCLFDSFYMYLLLTREYSQSLSIASFKTTNRVDTLENIRRLYFNKIFENPFTYVLTEQLSFIELIIDSYKELLVTHWFKLNPGSSQSLNYIMKNLNAQNKIEEIKQEIKQNIQNDLTSGNVSTLTNELSIVDNIFKLVESSTDNDLDVDIMSYIGQIDSTELSTLNSIIKHIQTIHATYLDSTNHFNYKKILWGSVEILKKLLDLEHICVKNASYEVIHIEKQFVCSKYIYIYFDGIGHYEVHINNLFFNGILKQIQELNNRNCKIITMLVKQLDESKDFSKPIPPDNCKILMECLRQISDIHMYEIIDKVKKEMEKKPNITQQLNTSHDAALAAAVAVAAAADAADAVEAAEALAVADAADAADAAEAVAAAEALVAAPKAPSKGPHPVPTSFKRDKSIMTESITKLVSRLPPETNKGNLQFIKSNLKMLSIPQLQTLVDQNITLDTELMAQMAMVGRGSKSQYKIPSRSFNIFTDILHYYLQFHNKPYNQAIISTHKRL